MLKTQPDNLARRAEQLLAEKAEVERLLDEVRAEGGGGEDITTEEEIEISGGGTASYRGLRLRARDLDDARKWGDTFLAAGESGVAVLAAEMPGEKHALFAFVTDDMISRGVRADAVVREVASLVGGRGGGRPHMAQAGVEDPTRIDEALAAGVEAVRGLLSGGSG